VVFAAIGGDPEHRVPVGERAPQRAAVAGGPPPRLIHVEALARANAFQQIVVRGVERARDPGEDRVDRAAADSRAEQFLAQLDDVAAADGVACREHRDRDLKPRPERARVHAGEQLAARAGAALRTSHADGDAR
jgi:hypothetical protein